MNDLSELSRSFGPGVWSMACLGHDTPYSLSKAGLIHVTHCQHATEPKLDLIGLTVALIGGADPGQCCGASPYSWITTHKNALQAAEDILVQHGLTTPGGRG